MSVADVLIDTRIAGDRAGATKMDRPEDVEPSPVNGRIYAAMTKSAVRGVSIPVDAANPVGSSLVKDALDAAPRRVAGNRNGYVLEMTETDGSGTALTFEWRLLLVCGLPEACETYFAGFPKEHVSPISCPDNIAFDPEGNLWLSTDGNVLGSNDGIFRVPVSGSERGFVKQFLTVPIGAEASGPLREQGWADAVDDRSAPRGRRHVRDSDQHLAAHRPLPSSLRGGDLCDLTP